jgi:polar amino acid transport system substrate-binding protein
VLSKAVLVKTKGYDEAVNMVLKGEVTAMLADHPICVVSVLRYPDSELFTIVSPFTYEPIGAVLPAIDPLFVNLVDNFLNTLESSGALDNLEDYWFQKGDWWDKIK